MPWCHTEFETDTGRLNSDGIRVDYFYHEPPRPGRKLFLLTRQDSHEPSKQIHSYPFGADGPLTVPEGLTTRPAGIAIFRSYLAPVKQR
jgi:hypothetical protein